MTDDLSDKEMIDWLRQPEDVRVCLTHGINMCRVKPSPREMYAADHMEKMIARIAELEASSKDTPDFPALVELASRLEGKDRKTCELALYTLKKQDERLAKRDARIAELEAFRRDAFKEVAELARECGGLRAQLPHPK